MVEFDEDVPNERKEEIALSLLGKLLKELSHQKELSLLHSYSRPPPCDMLIYISCTRVSYAVKYKF